MKDDESKFKAAQVLMYSMAMVDIDTVVVGAGSDTIGWYGKRYF